MNLVPLNEEELGGCVDDELDQLGADGTTDGYGGLWIGGEKIFIDPETAAQAAEVLASGGHIEYLGSSAGASASMFPGGDVVMREKIREAEKRGVAPELSDVLKEMLGDETTTSRRDELFDAFAETYPELPFFVAAQMKCLPFDMAGQLLASLRGTKIYDALMSELKRSENVASA